MESDFQICETASDITRSISKYWKQVNEISDEGAFGISTPLSRRRSEARRSSYLFIDNSSFTFDRAQPNDAENLRVRYPQRTNDRRINERTFSVGAKDSRRHHARPRVVDHSIRSWFFITESNIMKELVKTQLSLGSVTMLFNYYALGF